MEDITGGCSENITRPWLDISEYDEAEVLAALYNASRPQGIGFLHATPEDMSVEQARKWLGEQTSFDYLNGRIMKIKLDGSGKLNPRLYDRDLGEGAALTAILKGCTKKN